MEKIPFIKTSLIKYINPIEIKCIIYSLPEYYKMFKVSQSDSSIFNLPQSYQTNQSQPVAQKSKFIVTQEPLLSMPKKKGKFLNLKRISSRIESDSSIDGLEKNIEDSLMLLLHMEMTGRRYKTMFIQEVAHKLVLMHKNFF